MARLRVSHFLLSTLETTRGLGVAGPDKVVVVWRLRFGSVGCRPQIKYD